MSLTTYSAFKTDVKAIVFPEGEAENLFIPHDSYLQDALINLQTYVPCLKDNHVNFYTKDSFQEWCGVDFTFLNRGIIHAVYAFNPNSRRCRKYFYEAKSISYIENWIKNARCTTCPEQTDPDSPARSPDCDTLSDADTYCDEVDNEENDRLFKCTNRYYAIGPNNKLLLAPRFPCGYQIAVHWEGIKRSWAADDPIVDDMELKVTVAKHAQAQVALFLDRDTMIYDRIMHPKSGEFSIARADMIHRCLDERRVQERKQCIGGMDVLQPFFYDPLPTDDYTDDDDDDGNCSQIHTGAIYDPNGNVIGNVGDLYKSLESLGGDGSLWIKSTGNGTNVVWE